MSDAKRARASWARARSSAAKYRRRKEGWTPGDVLGTRTECWCGKPKNHDWPGKTEGAPHPRGGGDG